MLGATLEMRDEDTRMCNVTITLSVNDKKILECVITTNWLNDA